MVLPRLASVTLAKPVLRIMRTRSPAMYGVMSDVSPLMMVMRCDLDAPALYTSANARKYRSPMCGGDEYTLSTKIGYKKRKWKHSSSVNSVLHTTKKQQQTTSEMQRRDDKTDTKTRPSKARETAHTRICRVQ